MNIEIPAGKQSNAHRFEVTIADRIKPSNQPTGSTGPFDPNPVLCAASAQGKGANLPGRDHAGKSASLLQYIPLERVASCVRNVKKAEEIEIGYKNPLLQEPGVNGKKIV